MQEATRGWEVAEESIEDLERQLSFARTRLVAAEAEAATCKVRYVLHSTLGGYEARYDCLL